MQDFLKNNLKLLFHRSPYLYSLVENIPNDEKYSIDQSKSGNATLLGIFPDGTQKALHSKYDPINEAEQFIETIYSKEKANYVLIGLGLGYHLNSLHKKISSEDRIIIIEKNPFLFRLALSQNDFSRILKNPKVSWHIDINPDQIEQIFFEDRANLALNGFTPVILKPLMELEKVYYNLIQQEIEQERQNKMKKTATITGILALSMSALAQPVPQPTPQPAIQPAGQPATQPGKVGSERIVIKAGMEAMQGIPLATMLELYGNLVDRTILATLNLPKVTFDYKINNDLTYQEAQSFYETLLSQRG